MTEAETFAHNLNNILEDNKKMISFIKSIANHPSFTESENEFIEFYTSKESEAAKLLEEIGEL